MWAVHRDAGDMNSQQAADHIVSLRPPRIAHIDQRGDYHVVVNWETMP
jgi:hypothetical protein